MSTLEAMAAILLVLALANTAALVMGGIKLRYWLPVVLWGALVVAIAVDVFILRTKGFWFWLGVWWNS